MTIMNHSIACISSVALLESDHQYMCAHEVNKIFSHKGVGTSGSSRAVKTIFRLHRLFN